MTSTTATSQTVTSTTATSETVTRMACRATFTVTKANVCSEAEAEGALARALEAVSGVLGQQALEVAVTYSSGVWLSASVNSSLVESALANLTETSVTAIGDVSVSPSTSYAHICNPTNASSLPPIELVDTTSEPKGTSVTATDATTAATTTLLVVTTSADIVFRGSFTTFVDNSALFIEDKAVEEVLEEVISLQANVPKSDCDVQVTPLLSRRLSSMRAGPQQYPRRLTVSGGNVRVDFSISGEEARTNEEEIIETFSSPNIDAALNVDLQQSMAVVNLTDLYGTVQVTDFAWEFVPEVDAPASEGHNVSAIAVIGAVTGVVVAVLLCSTTAAVALYVKSSKGKQKKILETDPFAGADLPEFQDPRKGGGTVRILRFNLRGDEGAVDGCASYALGLGGVKLEAPCQRGKRLHFASAAAAMHALAFWVHAEQFTTDSPAEALRRRRILASVVKEDPTRGGFGSDWKAVKAILQAKFQCGTVMEDALLQTGDAFLLHQDVGRDTWWSDGAEGERLNWLGLQLMLIRDKFSGQRQWTDFISSVINPDNGVGRNEDAWLKVIDSAKSALPGEMGEKLPASLTHMVRYPASPLAQLPIPVLGPLGLPSPVRPEMPVHERQPEMPDGSLWEERDPIEMWPSMVL